MSEEQQNIDDLLERTRAIVETVVDGIIAIDEHGVIEMINPSAESLFGYAASEMIGVNISKFMPEPFAKEHNHYLRNYLTTGIKKVIGIGREVEGLRKDGSTFPMELAVSEMYVQGQRKFTGVVRDLTERRESEQSLENSEARYRAVLETIVDGIITIDSLGTIHTVNPAVEGIFGYGTSEMVGKNINFLMPAPYHDEHDGYLRHYLETNEKKVIGIGREVQGRRKDGSTFPLELGVSEFTLGDERMFAGVLRDVSSRKKMETELQEVTQRMKEQRMKDEFVSTISHELRTPLTSIRGSIGLLLGNAMGEFPEPARELLEIGHKNSERLLLLINDILDIAKIESGRLTFSYSPVDVNAFIEQAVLMNQSYAEQNGVSLRVSGRLQGAKVNADENRLMQVMSNLLSNAAKFSLPGSTVDVAAIRSNNQIRISVRDHGAGIPSEFQPRIFDKFTQADSSDTRHVPGTGLGLNISKAIVERHGGRISFATEAGFGTTFFFELPEWIEHDSIDKSTSMEPPLFSAVPRRSNSVLILEDDPDVASLLRLMLAQAGYEADVARSAGEAMEKLHRKDSHYAAMTLDIMLPDKDGITFYEELRGDPLTAELPVVVVSAKADHVKADLQANALGIVDWLQKPIDRERLLRSIRYCVKQSAGPPEILLVEDDDSFADALDAQATNSVIFSHVRNLEHAKKMLGNKNYDLVVLKTNLPGGSGLEVVEFVKNMAIPPQLVVCSAKEMSSEKLSDVGMVLNEAYLTDSDLVDRIKSLLARVELPTVETET